MQINTIAYLKLTGLKKRCRKVAVHHINLGRIENVKQWDSEDILAHFEKKAREILTNDFKSSEKAYFTAYFEQETSDGFREVMPMTPGKFKHVLLDVNGSRVINFK